MSIKYQWYEMEFDAQRWRQDVRAKKKQVGMNWQEIANLADLEFTGGSLSHWACGRGLPNIQSYTALCNALDLNASAYFVVVE